MVNTTSNISTSDDSHADLAATYYPLALIIVGTLLNILTFFILCRPTFQDTDKRPTIHYMRAIAIFDILMLYGWNLDHYLSGAYGYTLLNYSIPICKIISFLNYFAPQCSAWLRVFICVDRYLSLSRLHKTWFSHSKNVLIIIACIVIIFTIINFPFFLFACYYNEDGTVNSGARLYAIYPLWDNINLALYNCAPFVFMVILNSGVIYHLIHLHRTSTVQNSRINHRSISITLVITTFLFIVMTTPVTICYGFSLYSIGYAGLHLLDSMLYTYHILSFPLYMTTFTEFRQEVIRLITCRQWRNKQPSAATTKVTNAHS